MSVGCEKGSVIERILGLWLLMRLVNFCNECPRSTIMFCRAVLSVPDCVTVRVPMINRKSSQRRDEAFCEASEISQQVE